MIKLLILSGFIGIVCVKIHGMSFMKKLAAKIVMVYGMLGWVGLGFALLLFSMTELYEGKYGNSREERLLRVEREMGRGEMENAMQDMNVYKSYEADFEYAWERCAMYRAYNLYSLFSQASAANPAYASEAECYRQQVLQICYDSSCPENEPYVELYLQELE